MDTALETKPPEVPFAGSTVQSQAQAFYGGDLAFLGFLASERDRNYLLSWKAGEGEAAKKVILKVSNRGDPEGLLLLQTEVMACCFSRGCRVQQIYARAGEEESADSASSSQSRLLRLTIEGHEYPARLMSYVEGECLSVLDDTAYPDPDRLSLQAEAWGMAGQEVGKVSACMAAFYAEELKRGSEEVQRFRDFLDADFEWNLSNLRTVLRKYLKYFDPEGEGAPLISGDPAKRQLLERKGARVAELFGRHEEKYFSEAAAAGSSETAEATKAVTLTHHDPNDNNLVFSISNSEGGQQRVVSVTVLDFGDMGLSFPFADAAIGLAYAPSEACGEGFLRGWTQTCRGGFSLEATDELSTVIQDWALMRRVTSVCMSNFQAIQEPGDEYLQCSAAAMWKALGVQ